jgi:exonuclease VII small subunit
MRYNPTERLGVNAVERIVIEQLKWIFREQPIVDVGIDAMIEVVEDDYPTCKFIGSQIKSGRGNFHEKEKSWSYYASDIHYNYWTNANIPILLIAYIPEYSTAYWIPIVKENFIRNKRQWRIDIPKKQKFNGSSNKRLLELLEGATQIPDNMDWSLERAELLRSRVNYISQAATLIDELTSHFKALRDSHDDANAKYRVFIDRGLTLQSSQTKKVTKELAQTVKLLYPKIEQVTIEFSRLFAIGVDALIQMVQGCKQFELYAELEEILPALENFISSSEEPIRQTTDLKATVDKYAHADKELNAVSQSLSEVIGQVVREFKVAVKLTEDLVFEIKKEEE